MSLDVADALTLANRTFITMLVVMDPIGLAPIFIGLAGGRPSAERRALSLKASLVAGGILLAFGLFGRALLEKLGISLDAFRVAGGVLLFLIALDMVFARSNSSRESEEEEREAKDRPDISVFPLAIPLIAGPGTLASMMILASDAHGSVLLLSAVLLVTGSVLLLCYLALRLSGQIARLIGLTGVHVVTRVLGVLLGALAVQYVADGVRGFIVH
ncbi:MarC family protein [Deinococcus sp. KNUC1210]|uniref:MarC family protein n=1 Tax=Deinococcus sp. KNUC1210 TaxID=2917691 RepID=UPI001EF0118D|nr:MarC family protein [Deinococcus sp. KNUC1210]ULH16227.1 MarC family protein [Deinococcus sp. KNUC1210]